MCYDAFKEVDMLKPTKVYRSKFFTASLSDDPSGIWYLDVSCKTEHNGQTGTVTGHIPLCLDLKESPDGGLEAALSVMDDTPDEPEEGQDNILTFKPKGK
jgi:hypothetical protein